MVKQSVFIGAHTVVGQFGLKRCQKMREVMNVMNNKILKGFIENYKISV